MSVHRVGIAAIFISLTVSAYAANPFLDAKDDKPVSANFRGTVWNDDFPEHGIPHEIPLTARVITTRLAKMQWGAIFKIEFTDLKSRAPSNLKLLDAAPERRAEASAIVKARARLVKENPDGTFQKVGLLGGKSI
jgi:hypothetical protein